MTDTCELSSLTSVTRGARILYHTLKSQLVARQYPWMADRDSRELLRYTLRRKVDHCDNEAEVKLGEVSKFSGFG